MFVFLEVSSINPRCRRTFSSTGEIISDFPVCMKIRCFSFLCFGERAENLFTCISNYLCYFHFRVRNKGFVKNVLLGNESDEMDKNNSDLGFWDSFNNVGLPGDQGEEFITTNTRNNGANASDPECDFRTGNLCRWISELQSRHSRGDTSGSEGVAMDVNLNLGFGGEQPSSSSPAIGTGRGHCDRDSQNKRPKVHSFSLDWDTNFNNETHNLGPVHEVEMISNDDLLDSCIAEDDIQNNEDSSYVDDSEIRMDLTDDLLHMVFTFLEHGDLCRAAMVCRQWRDASSHEDFWRYLNFEGRLISAQQFEDMCSRYSNATAVNVYGTPDMYHLVMKAVSSLRNLEVLTLGKSQLDEPFFQILTECQMLRSLSINDATLGNGFQEIVIYHERLRDLQIMKCRLLRVSIRCPQLETLSLKRSSMPHAALNCPLLRELDMASCHKLSDAAIRSAATSCPLLESLDMSNCSCVSDETLREIAMACGSLHVLDASYCPNISLESVRLPMLTILKLHSCEGITSASIAAIAFSYILEVLELDNCNLLTSVSLDLPRLKTIRLVHCRKFVDLNLRSSMLSSITVSNCPSLQRISIISNALKKLVLQKQESLTTLVLHCHCLEEVDLTECESLTNSICEVFSTGGGCPLLKSLFLDNCESLTSVSFHSMSLVSLSLGGCRAITSVELQCPFLEHVSLDGCDHLEKASFSSVGLRSLNLGICPKLNVLRVEAPQMVSLELKGCGVLSEAFIYCPLLTSLDASFCCQLKDDFLSATTLSSPLTEVLVLMSCPSIGPNGLSSLRCLSNLTYLDLSYTFLVNLQPVFDSCLSLKVLKLQACKYLSDTSLEPVYKGNALPSLCELDLSYGALCQSAIEELLAGCMHLTHVSLNGCANMHDLDWGNRLSEVSSYYKLFDSPSQENSPSWNQRNRLLQNLNCVGCPNIKKVVIPPIAKCFHLLSLNLSLSSNLKEVNLACCSLSFLNLSNCSSLEILKLDCPRLTSLFLQSCNIDEEAVGTAVMRCSILETLDVRFCPKISPLNMNKLREACPNLKRIFSSLAPT